VEGHLREAGGVAQVDEREATVIADARNPARQRDLVARVREAEGGGVVGSVHRLDAIGDAMPDTLDDRYAVILHPWRVLAQP
jgi:hypothetical protein